MANSSSRSAIREHNREVWNRQVAESNMWTVPIDDATVAAARDGHWTVVLTGQTPVPRDWFPDLRGCDTLCLASGGGQQGPTLAAAGARVTVFDNSPAQLAQDRAVSDRHGLGIRTLEGDMADLSAFDDESFDLVFHPVSNVFAPDVRPVWREAYRVLRLGGSLLAGFVTPVSFLFDEDEVERTGELRVRHRVPFSPFDQLSDERLAAMRSQGEAFAFGHTLADQIGGQLEAGFVLVGLYEHHQGKDEWNDPIDDYFPKYIATRALKPR